MSDSQDPVRWTEAPDRAPPGAAELVRSLAAPPPLPPDLSAIVIPRARPRARRWIGPSLAATAVVIGGIVLWRFAPLDREQAPVTSVDEPATIERAESPVEPTVEPTAEPTEVAVVAPDITSAADPHAGSPPNSPPEPPAAPALARPARDPSQPPPAASGIGWLSVSTIPWSRLSLDGRDTGLSTPVIRHPLAAGTHVLELRTDEGASLRLQVHIRAGEVTRIRQHLDDPAPSAERGEGMLTISTVPWARVFIDGRDTGRNTPVRNLRVPAGHHAIGLRTEDGNMHTVQVTVGAGETVRVVRQLSWVRRQPNQVIDPFQ